MAKAKTTVDPSQSGRLDPQEAGGDALPLSRDSFEPLWHQIKQQVKGRILANTAVGYRVGDKMPTEEQVTSEYGVNRMTVHKALRCLADEGYVRRRAGKGTFVVDVGQGGGKAGTQDIGFLVARDWWMTGAFVTFQVAGMRKAAFGNEWKVQTILSSVEHERSLAGFCRGLQGLIVVGDCVEEPSLKEIQSSGVPVVVTLTDRTALGLESVVFDEEEAAFEQTRHLIGLGHREIGFINSMPMLVRNRRRLDGYRRALQAARLSVNERFIMEIELGPEGGYKAAERLLALRPRPTGLVLPSEAAAFGALRAAVDAGRSVPGEVSIISGGDVGTWYADPRYSTGQRMTCFSYSYEQMGAVAIERLMRRINDPLASAICTTLHGKLVLNETTGGVA